MRVHLTTLGCRLNEAELQTWARGFCAAGHRLVSRPAEADLLVINTCAVTAEAMRKSRQAIRRLQREQPDARLVASGCFATLHQEETARGLRVDLVVRNAEKDRLVELAAHNAEPATRRLSDTTGDDLLFPRRRTRAFVKVQDGCRYRCSYCIVTVARGEERSRRIDEVVAEIRHLGEQGVQEAVLTGVHLGGYGAGLGTNLSALVWAVLTETQIPRLRLSSVEPWDLPEDFFGLFRNPRLMPHLHLPLQNGSDAVLRRMARRYRTECFARLAQRARREVPDLNLTTDIIVGFPGETEAEWQETLRFVTGIGFAHIHIFPFSARQGTRAARLPNPVDPAIVKARAHELRTVAQRAQCKVLQGFRGRTLPVLIEGRSEPAGAGRLRWWGYTPNYLRVALENGLEPALENRIVPVHLTAVAADGTHLEGSIAEPREDSPSAT
jgi:threonylcarbamoyladenosine tRNA methylthiotransferase MtaB